MQLVRMDMEGGHFRPADPSERARQRAKELGFLVAYARKAAARGRRHPRYFVSTISSVFV